MKNDAILDDLERSELQKTERRRARRTQRYQRGLMIAFGVVVLIVLALPSIISHSGVANSLLTSQAARYGWTASAESIRVGWITPLSVRDLTLVGESGDTSLNIRRLDSVLTVLDLIRLDPARIGQLSLRGVELRGSVYRGGSSIESDLATLLETEGESSDEATTALIAIQEARAVLVDATTGKTWDLDQANLELRITEGQVEGEIAGVTSETGGSGGAIESTFRFDPRESIAAQDAKWTLSLHAESFPLSVADLVVRRLSETIAGLPDHVAGDTTGRIAVRGNGDGSLHAKLDQVRVRNLQTMFASPSTHRWSNSLATFDGKLAISGDWLVGQQMNVTTDFASANVDGAFPTSISLTGADDNVLSWLQTLQGKARVDVDLAALDRALPGLIPVRDQTELVSGRVLATIDNTNESSAGSSDAQRTSQLTLRSESLNARAGGRIVTIEPIELSATVGQDNGALRAEQFDLKSSFATAQGSGTLRDGSAMVKIDFDQLFEMLQPIVDLSGLSLGGQADGNVRWVVTRDRRDQTDRWDLSGQGVANDLLVTLAGDHRFRRAIVQGELSATGVWEADALKELTTAVGSINSGGVELIASLTAPVESPSGESTFPVRVTTDGRLENFNESLRPFLPQDLDAAEGRLSGYFIADVARSRGVVRSADFVVRQPRILYDGTWYSQPELALDFSGEAHWPSGRWSSREINATSEALTLRASGQSDSQATQMDIAWNADLQRLQQSVQSTLARAAAVAKIQSISYRPVESQSYQFAGRSSGTLSLRREPTGWAFDAKASGTDLRIDSPPPSRNVPPGTFRSPNRQNAGSGFTASQETPDPLWYEPRLKLEGAGRYDPVRGTVRFDGLQVACDWFAGSLAGRARVAPAISQVQLNGPAHWKMDVIANRLSELTGTELVSSGMHDGEIEIVYGAGENATSPTGPASALKIKTDLGWQQLRLAGVDLGRANLPLEISEDRVKIASTSIPILASSTAASANGEAIGTANFAATVDWGPGATVVRLSPGSKLQQMRITPEAAAQWLQYVTPLAAGATRIDGSLAAEFDQAVINLDAPENSVVRGRLNVQQMRVESGPLANQVIGAVDQIRSLAKLAGGQATDASDDIAATLIEMPPQTIDFSLENGVVTHRRVFLTIDRANLITSGQVALDSRINLATQIQLDPRWLGSDLKDLAGQTVTLPITGTLSRPQLDASVIKNLVTQFGQQVGAQVIQSEIEGMLQKQLGSGLEQLGSGLEKVFGF